MKRIRSFRRKPTQWPYPTAWNAIPPIAPRPKVLNYETTQAMWTPMSAKAAINGRVVRPYMTIWRPSHPRSPNLSVVLIEERRRKRPLHEFMDGRFIWPKDG